MEQISKCLIYFLKQSPNSKHNRRDLFCSYKLQYHRNLRNLGLENSYLCACTDMTLPLTPPQNKRPCLSHGLRIIFYRDSNVSKWQKFKFSVFAGMRRKKGKQRFPFEKNLLKRVFSKKVISLQHG